MLAHPAGPLASALPEQGDAWAWGTSPVASAAAPPVPSALDPAAPGSAAPAADLSTSSRTLGCSPLACACLLHASAKSSRSAMYCFTISRSDATNLSSLMLV